ncbi:MAG: 2-hydroxyacyl-CoA dehydratase [Deltaproteobacteria bacterium]|nr:MAG: 2-hydroxyacyl-CoA dehydratase [Deltaproteobacteria bacterium]
MPERVTSYGKSVGFTATIPVEIIFAGGYRPVDLNNLFITSVSPSDLVLKGESAGFAHNICSWIKGIYSVVLEYGFEKVIAVTGGDCSNTIALGEVLQNRGVEVIPFEYPGERSREQLVSTMETLMSRLHVSWDEVKKAKQRLDPIRKKLRELDRLTYESNLVTGFENHLFLVNSSDFWGEPEKFEAELDKFLARARKRPPMNEEVRIGYLGVPPIFDDLYEMIEQKGGRVVFNEMQRQFSMPFFDQEDIVGQYLRYTYPYDAQGRVADILEAVEQRAIDGLIHYTQTFCYRQIYDIILREKLPVPILTLEGDRPGKVDTRTALRIETFLEMLRGVTG